MLDTEKQKRINQELKRINERFTDADENQKAIVKPLIQNAAFMKVTLEDLQEIINAEGATEAYQNGANQHGVKQSATLQSYNSLIKNYTAVIKALSRLLPPAKKEMPIINNSRPAQKTEEEWRELQRKYSLEHDARINAEINAAAEKQRREREENNRSAG